MVVLLLLFYFGLACCGLFATQNSESVLADSNPCYFSWLPKEMRTLLQLFSHLFKNYVFTCFWLCWVFTAMWAFSGRRERELLSSCRAQAFHCGGSSCCQAWALGHAGFSSCGAQAKLLRGMRDHPGPGTDPVSPELQGGFLATGPPRNPFFFHLGLLFLFTNIHSIILVRSFSLIKDTKEM